MPKLRIPNLFIIGAPKCGTTALSYYLAGHSDIYMSEQSGIKEPFFFDKDLLLSHIPWKIRDWDAYTKLFAPAPENIAYIGEASPFYLYSKCAVPEILERSTNPQFIVCVRNPIEIAQSLHNQHSKHSIELPNFERAWELQESRKCGHDLPSTFSDGALLQYGEIAKLGKQLQRIMQQVPRVKGRHTSFLQKFLV